MKIKKIILSMILGSLSFVFLLAQNTGLTTPQSTMQSQNAVSYINYNSDVYSAVEVDPDDYIVGSGDKFLIQVNNLASISYGLDVSPTGDLTLPGIGQVHVSELTLSKVTEVIRNKFKQRMATAEVDVNLIDVRNVKIPIFGAIQNTEMVTLYTDSDVNDVTEPSVRTPKTAGTLQRREMTGEITNKDYVLPASLRLDDLLSVSTLHYLAKDFAIEVRGYNDTNVVNIYDYYMFGKMDQNPSLYEIRSIYIPFADAQKECISVYGPINTKSIVPIIPGEKVYEFLQRKIQITQISNYDAVTLKRDGKILVDRSNNNDDLNIELLPGDELEISSAKRIMVNGFVNQPGIYNYIQGNTVADYIAMAGGINNMGSNKTSMIIRNNHKIKNAEAKLVERGDIIVVKRSIDHIFVGNYSVLQFLATIASMTLTFIAAYNSIQ